MPLTPADVEQKTFSTALRGYELNEVDDFLDEVVTTIKSLQDDLVEAKARIAELESGAAKSAETTTADASAVGRALVAAQETADKIIADAKTEAEELLAEAKSEAGEFEKEKEERRAAAEAEMGDLSERVAGVRERLALLATTVADRLDEMDETINGLDLDELAAAAAGEAGEESDEAGAESDDSETEEEAVTEPSATGVDAGIGVMVGSVGQDEEETQATADSGPDAQEDESGVIG